MSDLVLLIPENTDHAWAWVFGVEQGCAQNDEEKTALSSLGFTRVVAVLPGMQVVTKIHTLDALSEKQKQQAAGFSIEDELAAPLHDTHIAFDAKTARLSVIGEAVLRGVIEALEAAGLSADMICADYDIVSGEGAFVYDGRLVQSRANGLGVAIDVGLASYILEDGQNMPAVLFAEQLLGKITESLARGHTPINLRQGTFSKRARLTGGRLKRLALLAAACCVVFVGLNFGQGQVYAKKTKAAQAEMVQIYADIFPDTNMPKNPAPSVLRAQADTSTQGGDVFVNLSKILALSVKELKGVEIVSLGYDQGRGQLSLSVGYTSFDDVERLKNAIAKHGGVFTESGTRQDGDRLTGDAVLKEAP